MALSSSEIKSKTFNSRLRGFDQEEVTQFLTEVGQAYEDLSQENLALSEKVERLSENLDEYVEKHDSLNRSILVAQDAADRLKEDAHAEANHLVTEARDEAERIRVAAREKSHELLSDVIGKVHYVQDEMEALRQESVSFKKNLHDMLKTYHSTIMDNRWDKVMNLKAFNQVSLDQTKEAVEMAAQVSDSQSLEVDDTQSNVTEDTDEPSVNQSTVGLKGQSDEGQTVAQEVPAEERNNAEETNNE